MLKNGRTTGDDKGESNLIPGMEDDFARYLADIAVHFQTEGIPVRYISPVNEPQWNWKLENGQEGSHFTPDGVVEIGRALVRELKARGSDIRVSLPDSGKMWDTDYTLGLYRKLAADPEFTGWLPHFSVHAYWSSLEDKKKLASAISDSGMALPLWQSEWCQMEGGFDSGMGPALTLARCVHEDLTVLDCTAWQTWIAVSCYDFKDGLVYVDLATRKTVDMKRLWALGNWSRFVRPGYARIEADSGSDALLVSAWIAPDGKEAVLVVVNDGAEPVAADISGLAEMPGLSAEPVMTSWETSEAFNLKKVQEGKAGTCIFPSRSITTLVIR
jgi:O-glycosyl hydrolase